MGDAKRRAPAESTVSRDVVLAGGLVVGCMILLGLLGGMGLGGGSGESKTEGPGGGGDDVPAGDPADRTAFAAVPEAGPFQWELRMHGGRFEVLHLRPGFLYEPAAFPWDEMQPGQTVVLLADAGSHGATEDVLKRAKARVGKEGTVWVVADAPKANVGGLPHLRAIFSAEHAALVRTHANRLIKAPRITQAGRFIAVEGDELDAMGAAEARRMAADLGLPLVQLVECSP